VSSPYEFLRWILLLSGLGKERKKNAAGRKQRAVSLPVISYSLLGRSVSMSCLEDFYAFYDFYDFYGFYDFNDLKSPI
jgi:hypothetical protein